MKNTLPPLTVATLIAHLQRFSPDEPCLGHFWLGEDLADMEPGLSAEEITTVMEAADRQFSADISLSWYYLRHCIDDVLDAREAAV